MLNINTQYNILIDIVSTGTKCKDRWKDVGKYTLKVKLSKSTMFLQEKCTYNCDKDLIGLTNEWTYVQKLKMKSVHDNSFVHNRSIKFLQYI